MSFLSILLSSAVELPPQYPTTNIKTVRIRQKRYRLFFYYSPAYLFCCEYAEYYVEALKIRFPEFLGK